MQKNDSQGSDVSDEDKNNTTDGVIQVAFVDEEDPEIRVARHNLVMHTTGVLQHLHCKPNTRGKLQDRGWFSAMSRNRFNAIMRYMKFCDEQIDKPAVEQGQPCYDKLYKVTRFLSMLLPKYEMGWISSQWPAIDEKMIPYCAHVGFCQFIANKPNYFGIKVRAMADVKTGYILKQQIYTGKNLTAVNNTEDPLMLDRLGRWSHTYYKVMATRDTLLSLAGRRMCFCP